MKRLLYATGNSSKVYTMRRRLAGQMVEVLTPSEAGVQLHVEENGATPVENALIKAWAYYAATGIPAIAGDSAFYIDGLPAAQQPGLHVRRVDGRELSDEELIIHYAALARKGAEPFCCGGRSASAEQKKKPNAVHSAAVRETGLEPA